MDCVLIIDDQPGYNILVESLNSKTELFEFKLVASFLDGIKAIQSGVQFNYIIVDLSLKFSEHYNNYQDDYGWFLIALAKIHTPRAKIILNSNTSLHKYNILKSYIGVRISAVAPKGLTTVFTNMSLVKQISTGKPSAQQLDIFNLHADTSFEREDLQRTEGLAPTELLVLEFACIRSRMPGGQVGPFSSGEFIQREPNGKGLDKNFINKTIHHIRVKAKEIGVTAEDLEVLAQKLMYKNFLTSSKSNELENMLEAITMLANNHTLVTVSDTLNINRKTLSRKLQKLYEQMCSSELIDGKVPTSQQKAERILSKVI